jgi:FkbM family methyltransferase
MQFQFNRYILFYLCLALISDRGICESEESLEHSEAVEEEHVQHESNEENILHEEEHKASEEEIDHDDSSVEEDDDHTKKLTTEEEQDIEAEIEAEVEEEAQTEIEAETETDAGAEVEAEVEAEIDHDLSIAAMEGDHLEEPSVEEEHSPEPEPEPEHDKNTEESVQKPEPSDSIDKSDKLDNKVDKTETEDPKKQEKQAEKILSDDITDVKPIGNGDDNDSNEEDGENDGCSPVVEECEEVTAPLYNKLVPIRGWNRYSGDSAKTVSQWFRWWKYLRLSKPILMSWINGLTLKIYPKNEIGRALFVSGIYDPNNLVVVGALLKNGSVFIDAGANMGYSSLLMANVVGETGHVYALEPSKRDYKRLEDNIELNGLSGTVSHYPYALADVKGSATLQVAGEERNALNTLGSEFSVKGVEKISSETVNTITLDEFIEEEEIRKVDVLKLDIEGSEFNALKGAMKTIQEHKPAIMLGVNITSLESCGADLIRIEKLLRELGYYIYKLVEMPFTLEKIENIIDANSPVVFCLHSSVKPPKLPQPKRFGIAEHVLDFFR